MEGEANSALDNRDVDLKVDPDNNMCVDLDRHGRLEDDGASEEQDDEYDSQLNSQWKTASVLQCFQ